MLLPSIKYDFTILRRVIMTLVLLKTIHRGDWGTLKRKNSNTPNIDLILKIEYFDDTYGYSIQWGIFEQEMKIIRNV